MSNVVHKVLNYSQLPDIRLAEILDSLDHAGMKIVSILRDNKKRSPIKGTEFNDYKIITRETGE